MSICNWLGGLVITAEGYSLFSRNPAQTRCVMSPSCMSRRSRISTIKPHLSRGICLCTHMHCFSVLRFPERQPPGISCPFSLIAHRPRIPNQPLQVQQVHWTQHHMSSACSIDGVAQHYTCVARF